MTKEYGLFWDTEKNALNIRLLPFESKSPCLIRGTKHDCAHLMRFLGHKNSLRAVNKRSKK